MAIQRNRENFPLWVHADLDDLKIDPFTMRVYVHLCRRANGKGKAWPSREAIAEHCGISEKQVTRCVQVLEDEGLVVVVRTTQGNGGRANTYWLTSTDAWLQKAVAKTKNQAGVGTDSPDPAGGVGTEQGGGGDCESLSHTKEGKPEEGKPIKGPAPSIFSAEAVFASSIEARGGGKAKAPKKVKAAPDPKTFLVHAPAEFRHDDDFVHAWNEWGQNRIENKNPLTERGAKIALGKLAKVKLPVAIEALNRATAANWSGVFPESIGSGGNSDKFRGASGEQPKQDFGW